MNGMTMRERITTRLYNLSLLDFSLKEDETFTLKMIDQDSLESDNLQELRILEIAITYRKPKPNELALSIKEG